LFEAFASTPGIHAINFGDPEMQNSAARYEVAARHKVFLLWDGELSEGCERINTCINHKLITKSWAKAELLARELHTGIHGAARG
jgi:tryptophan synthase beta subunit